MPTVDYIEKVLGMQDVEIKKVEKSTDKTIIELRLRRKPHICPECGRETSRIHDYRYQKVKDLPAFGNDVELHIN